MAWAAPTASELGAGLAETTPRRRIQFVESSRAGGSRRRKREEEEEVAACPPGVVPLDTYEGRNGDTNTPRMRARGGDATHRTADDDASSSDCDDEDDELSDGPSSVLDLEWKDVRKVGSGLNNLGNTCFLNSVLQCLTHTPPLAAIALSISNYPRGALYDILNHIRQALMSNGSVLSPMQLIRGLRHTSKQFRHGRQEDAHEYARCLLESCQKEGTSGRKNTHQLNAKEIIRNVFGGKLCSQVKCLASSCNHISNTFDPILDLSLEITRASTLTKALQRFTAVEYLDGENKYECENCRARVRASKRFWIESPPNVLTIHLKRFEFGAYGRKIDKHIKFPTLLDLTPYMRAPGRHRYEYNLYAVLVHAGHSTHSGHYYSFIRAPSGLWHAMDDNHVRQVGENVVLQQRAYMLFYVRKVSPLPSQQQRQTTKKNKRARERTALAAEKAPGVPSSSVTTGKEVNSAVKKQRDDNGGSISPLSLDVLGNGNVGARLTPSPKSNGTVGNLKTALSPPFSKAEAKGRHVSDTKEPNQPTSANGGDGDHLHQHLLTPRGLHSARRHHGMNGSSPLSAGKPLSAGRGIFNLQNLVRQFLRRKKLRRLRRGDKVLSPTQKRRSHRLELKNLMRYSKAGGVGVSNGSAGGGTGSNVPGQSPSGAGGYISQSKRATRRELNIGAGTRQKTDSLERVRTPPPCPGPSHRHRADDDVERSDITPGEPPSTISTKMRRGSEATKMAAPAKKRRRAMISTSSHTANVLGTEQWEDADTQLKATADGLKRRGAPKAKVIDEWDAEYDRGKQRKLKRRENGDDPDAEEYKAAVKALSNPFQNFSSGKRNASKAHRNSRAAAKGREGKSRILGDRYSSRGRDNDIARGKRLR